MQYPPQPYQQPGYFHPPFPTLPGPVTPHPWKNTTMKTLSIVSFLVGFTFSVLEFTYPFAVGSLYNVSGLCYALGFIFLCCI